jgi:hypothetical protein
MLERLRQLLAERRDRHAELLDAQLSRELIRDERHELRLLMGGGDESISSAQDRVRAAEESERAQARANRVWARTSDGRTMTASGVSVGREGRTYSPHGEHSWIRDAIGVRIHGDYTGEARERLLQNSLELRDWAQQQERALSTTDGAGGEFVPPLWLVEQALEVARAGRVTADRVSNQDMPGGTDSINIPKVATTPRLRRRRRRTRLYRTLMRPRPASGPTWRPSQGSRLCLCRPSSSSRRTWTNCC